MGADTQGPVVVLADASTPVEQRLIDSWLADGGLRDEPGPTTRLPLKARSLEHRLVGRSDDPLIVPVKVAWLPPERDGTRRARFSDVMALTNPRNPNRFLQHNIVRKSPDRFTILTGEPARLSEMRARLVESDGDPAPASFSRFIIRNAVVSLARAERKLVGDRYKVPRLLAEQILDSPAFRRRLSDIARETGISEKEALDAAQSSLRELVAVQSRLVTDLFTQAMHPIYGNAWTVDVDESGLADLRELNKANPLVFMPSHRSYADAFVLGDVLSEHDFPRNHLMGGANLTFWPIGPIARRAGTVFIRRSFGDDQIYKASLEEYFAHLLSKRFNLEWYFEGGRTRTGKLRPPKYGLLAYVANAVRTGRAPDAMLVPVSITYERMAEVGAVAAEQTGAKKQPEGLKWLANYARNQQDRAGNVYVRFGTPLSLREQLIAGGDPDLIPDPPELGEAERRDRSRLALQKVGFEVAVGINRATPITVNSLVTLALLGVRDRALTLDEVRAVIRPVRHYIAQRGIPQGELSLLDDDAGLARVLRRLDSAGVLTTYDGGLEPVYSIERGQHLVAAFYRNSGIHWFVNRAILELAILHAHLGGYTNSALAGWRESKRIRDLLKFEFFFPERDTFEAELTAELALIAPEWRDGLPTAQDALTRLVDTGFFMAHRTLRSFFDAQLVVAERLAARTADGPLDTKGFLDECVAVGQQMLLQARLHGPESVSSELFSSALQLAENRGLLRPADDTLQADREEFAQQLRALGESLALAESLDVSNRKVQP